MSIINYYTDKDFAETVLKENWKYLTLDIAECTEKALDKKCDFILKCQSLNWKPLFLDYKENVKVYIKKFYVEK